jgi:hypothetical protein
MRLWLSVLAATSFAEPASASPSRWNFPASSTDHAISFSLPEPVVTAVASRPLSGGYES